MKNCNPYVLAVLLLAAFESGGQDTSIRSINPTVSGDGSGATLAQKGSATRVILIGTGTPAIDPDRSGPCTAIVVNDTAYIVDMGPGLVRRARSAQIRNTIPALDPLKFRVVFVTHLHSDHTVGYPDLIFSPWTLGRRFALEVYGPKGIKSMTEHLLEAYREDIETRTNPNGNQRDFPGGHKVNAHEIKSGVIYKDNNVTVTAFATKHAMESYGYRFDTKDRSIVISGDTNPTEATIAACNSCDVLIHEVHSPVWLESRPATFQQFASKYHTTTPELAELSKRARPKLLILYHWNAFSVEELFREMSTLYTGHFVVARDLDVY
ncbi:MAG TPA: MBL fold metallo-hydrolase [Chryseolinea sp.]|nr:MBL fold metallo-hydrolase [Chryseolinea sp.]